MVLVGCEDYSCTNYPNPMQYSSGDFEKFGHGPMCDFCQKNRVERSTLTPYEEVMFVLTKNYSEGDAEYEEGDEKSAKEWAREFNEGSALDFIKKVKLGGYKNRFAKSS